jgi:molybdopterin-guanine dinucleotide biosynthesis protein A
LRNLGAILIGGKSKRMGQDKAKIRLSGRILLDHVLDRLGPQVSQVSVVGGDPDLAQSRDLTGLADAVPGGRGPLAGVLSALEWAADVKNGIDPVFICAVDMPYLPKSIVEKLAVRLDNYDIIFPVEDDQPQYMGGLWSPRLAKQLRHALETEELESVRDFARTVRTLDVLVSEMGISGPENNFLNINSPEDLRAAERLTQS